MNSKSLPCKEATLEADVLKINPMMSTIPSRKSEKITKLPEFLLKNDKYNDTDEEEYIPCLFLPCDTAGNKLVIYFHGNAEDVGLAFDLLTNFGEELKMHVLAVEYPGYGL